MVVTSTGWCPRWSSRRSDVDTTGEVWTRSTRRREGSGHDGPMSGEETVGVWSPWRLNADAVAEALVHEGVPATSVDDPSAVAGLLVGGVVDPQGVELLEARRRAGRLTVVWGGTLPPPGVTMLRASGAAAYVSAPRRGRSPRHRCPR